MSFGVSWHFCAHMWASLHNYFRYKMSTNSHASQLTVYIFSTSPWLHKRLCVSWTNYCCTCFQMVMMLSAGYLRIRDALPGPVWMYPVSYIAFHTYSIQVTNIPFVSSIIVAQSVFGFLVGGPMLTSGEKLQSVVSGVTVLMIVCHHQSKHAISCWGNGFHAVRESLHSCSYTIRDVRSRSVGSNFQFTSTVRSWWNIWTDWSSSNDSNWVAAWMHVILDCRDPKS